MPGSREKVISDTWAKAFEIRKQNAKPCICNYFERLHIPMGK
jgi:hypothetical protein